MLFVRLASYLAWLATAAQLSAAGLQVTNPRCEFGENPLGVDTSQPRLTWQLTSDERGARQTAYQILVASTAEELAADRGDLWDSGRIESAETVLIPYAGKPLVSSQQLFWKVRAWNEQGKPSDWSPEATWTMGILRPEDWKAKWIVAPWQTESILMRREFTAQKQVRRAVVHVCGLGHFELFLSGQKVGDHLLSPGWTKYNRTCLYETHDVTALVASGKNALGMALGDGMYHTELRSRYSKFEGSFGPQRAIVQLEIEYADGQQQTVVSDDNWTVNPGPITYTDVFGGEDYDARRLPQGWNNAGFDDADWPAAEILVRPSGQLIGFCGSAPPLKIIEHLQPVARRAFGPAREVIDFGQNTSIMPRITVTGPAGSAVRLTHAEVLNNDGTINRSTCGAHNGPAYWQYTKATDGPENWFPQFFYVGCRYLQLDKLPARGSDALPEISKLVGEVVHSSAEPAGDFSSSSELYNRIRTLVRWAQRSNYVSVLTDCPHREKLGWLEQYHLCGPAVRYEFSADRLFIKSMRDMADSQRPSGDVPSTAPEYVEFENPVGNAIEYNTAIVQVPWQHYEATGDVSLLRDYYEPMRKHVEYLSSQAKGYLLDNGLGDWYDLGPNKPGYSQNTPAQITCTVFYFHNAALMARTAALLGKDADAARYSELADNIRQAWIEKFRNADGTYATGSQVAHAMALEFELAEANDRPQVFAALVKDIEKRGYANTAGDIGHRFVLEALAHGDRSDLIDKILHQAQHPGYAYQLNLGATSLTEAWDAATHSSHNHFMMGHITEWFYKHLVGIGRDESAPGYAKLLIAPQPVGDVTWAEAEHQTIRGPVKVRWERVDEVFRVRFSIPANTTATVKLPAPNKATITEGGQAISQVPEIRSVVRNSRQAILQIDSGEYEIAINSKITP